MAFDNNNFNDTFDDATVDAPASTARGPWARVKELLANLTDAAKKIVGLQTTVDAERERADAAEQRAIAAEQRADAEHDRAEAALQRVLELERNNSKDSRTSSKPPSADSPFRKPAPAPRSTTAEPKRKVGGQSGHPGATLMQRTPDVVVELSLPLNCTCGLALEPTLVSTRQVLDIPKPQIVVTEYHVYAATCQCGKVHHSETPVGVNAPVQYGAGIAAATVLISQEHAVSCSRTAEVMSALTGCTMTASTVVSLASSAARKLTAVNQAIKEAVGDAPVVHADETGVRVGTRLMWLHAAVTEQLTWLGVHDKRGLVAMSALGVLDKLLGTLVHDGLASYRDFDVTHALCNAHHLRELVHVFEEYHQPLQPIFAKYPRAISMELRLLEALLGTRVTRREIRAGRHGPARIDFEVATLGVL